MKFLLTLGGRGVSAKVLTSKFVPMNEDENDHIISAEADLEKFGGPALISVYNAVAMTHTEFGMREVSRFATHGTAVKRVWGALVRLHADHVEKVRDAEPVSKKVTPAVLAAMPIDPTKQVEPFVPVAAKEEAPAPVMDLMAAGRKVDAQLAAERQTVSTGPVAQQVELKELPPITRAQQKLKDKFEIKAKKIYAVKPGGVQAKCIELLSRMGGIHIDEFVVEMNKLGKGKWTRGNTWSSLVYTLNTYKGYGLKCHNEMLSVDGEPNA